MATKRERVVPAEQKKMRKGGRQKGTPNKVTSETKKMIAELVQHGLQKAKTKLDAIENPKDYLDALSRYLPYVLPKQQEVKVEDVGDKAPARIKLPGGAVISL